MGLAKREVSFAEVVAAVVRAVGLVWERVWRAVERVVV